MINQILWHLTFAIILYTIMALWLIFVLWSYVILIIFFTAWIGCCVYEEFTRKEYFSMYFIAMYVLIKILKLLFLIYLLTSMKIIFIFIYIYKSMHPVLLMSLIIWLFFWLCLLARENLHFASPIPLFKRIEFALEFFLDDACLMLASFADFWIESIESHKRDLNSFIKNFINKW